MKNIRSFTKPGLAFALAALLLLAGCASNSPAPVSDRGGQPMSTSPTPAAPKDTYTVKSGDTVYSIAREHKMDFRELIAMNNIESPDRITPGKVLKIKPPADQSSSVASTAPVSTDVVVSRPIGNDPVIEKRPLGANTDALRREPKAGKEAYSDQALAQAQNPGQPKPAVVPASAAATEVKPEPKPAEAAPASEELAWIWPAGGKVITQFSEGGNKGIDIAGKMGDQVVAVGDGRVTNANNALRGYGYLIVIKHSGNFITVYAHNSKLLVKDGQTVTKGQKIAEMGNTDADQVKLHFEVRQQGKPVDPLQYLPKR